MQKKKEAKKRKHTSKNPMAKNPKKRRLMNGKGHNNNDDGDF